MFYADLVHSFWQRCPLRRLKIIGNPIVKTSNYRLVLIHALDCIEEIDCVLITPAERQAASEFEGVRWQSSGGGFMPLAAQPQSSSASSKTPFKFSNVLLDGSQLIPK